METDIMNTEAMHQMFHAINNRINALAIGIGILQQNEHKDVRDIANMMEDELDALHQMLEAVRTGNLP